MQCKYILLMPNFLINAIKMSINGQFNVQNVHLLRKSECFFFLSLFVLCIVYNLYWQAQNLLSWLKYLNSVIVNNLKYYGIGKEIKQIMVRTSNI